MTAERRLMGLFQDAEQVVAALGACRERAWAVTQVHGPIPNHKIAAALDLPKSRVGYYTLAGGIIGFFTGFLLASYCSVQWNLVVSGKPVVALVPFFIVGFEFTILFSVFGNVIGLLNEAKLPDWRPKADYDPRCSGDRYAITVACEAARETELRQFFQERGAQVSLLETAARPA